MPMGRLRLWTATHGALEGIWKHADGAGDGARKKKVRPSGGQGGQTHDAEIEAELDAWVRAKRKGNFEKADEIRAQLREKGIATEKERPFKRKGKEKAS